MMRQPETFRCSVYYGEPLTWEPPSGAGSFRTWFVESVDSGARWFECGGYNLLIDEVIPAPERDFGDSVSTDSYERFGRAQPEGARLAVEADRHVEGLLEDLAITAEGVRLPWAAVNKIAALRLLQPFQVISYNAAGRAESLYRFEFPIDSASPLDEIIQSERAYLAVLLQQRLDVTDTGGVRERREVEGQGEVFGSIEVLDRRVQEIRARIRWFESYAAGSAMPRQELW